MRQFEREKKTIRDAYGAAVLELAKKDPMVIGIGADTVNNIGMKAFAQEFPDRVINCGIAEQDMMDIASGLAANGFKVFGGSFGPFVTMRGLEQYRSFIAYPHLKVVMMGGMAGLSASNEGVTHQCTEDLAIMCSIPNNVVLAPADIASLTAMVNAVYENVKDGPAYIRGGKFGYLHVFDEYDFEIGKAKILEDGKDVTLICAGTSISRCLQAKDVLEEEGISARVLDCSSIKPLDEEAVIAAAKETGAIVTVEEATIVGGLGAAVASVLVENCPVPMKRCGVPDCFAESGDHDPLMDKYGLAVDTIVEAAKATVARK